MSVKEGNRKNKLKILFISLIILVLIFSIGSMIFVKILYDDHFPRTEKPDPRYTGYLTYDDIVGYERQEVKFPSGKNTLAGYTYGNSNTKGLVVISHGQGYSAERYLSEIMYFVDKGWRVFSFNNTGVCESEGKNTVGLSQSLIDLDAALTYIEANDSLKNLPVMLYGHSWGGYAVTAVLNYNHKIYAAASIAGYNSPMELALEQVKSMIGVFSKAEYPFLWAYQTMLFGDRIKLTAVDGINKSGIPVMIIHGDKDESVSYYGAGIIAHKSGITNPNVVYKTCSAENHNGHNNLFVSEEATEYINIKNQEYKPIYDKYHGKVPDDIRAKYYEGVDKFKTSQLDPDFMNEVNSFYENALK